MINTYDIDGVINLGPNLRGLTPRYGDIIITGRSFEEKSYTEGWLQELGIYNTVFFNPAKFTEKCRKSSGIHKGNTIKYLIDCGIEVGCHFEDDEVQAAEIRKIVDIPVIMVISDLVEKENVWHGDPNNQPGAVTE